MGWFGKLMFGSMGLLMGGPLGAIAGAALGHALVDKAAENTGGYPRVGYAEQSQAAYFVTMFAVLGKIAKIDGTVSREEIAVVNRFIDGLNLGGKERQFARQVFNEAKDSAYAIDDFAVQFRNIVQGQPAVLNSFLDVLFRVAAADGTLHPSEKSALERMKNIFQVNDAQFNSIKANYFKDVDRYYKVLNCTPQSPNDEIRSNYKKLVKDFHPDTIVSKGLPEEFTEFAAERFREIQEAYDHVRKERGL